MAATVWQSYMQRTSSCASRMKHISQCQFSEKNDIVCQIDHYLTAALMEIRKRLGLTDVQLEN